MGAQDAEEAAQLAQGFAGQDRARIAKAQGDSFKELNNSYDPVESMNLGTAPAAMTKPTTKPTAAAKPMDPWTPVTAIQSVALFSREGQPCGSLR